MLTWQNYYELIDLLTFDLGGSKLSIKLSHFVDIPWTERVNNHTGRRHTPALCFGGEKKLRSVICRRGWSTFCWLFVFKSRENSPLAFFCLVCPFFWKLSEYTPVRPAITLPNVGSNPSLITYHRNFSQTVTSCRWSCSANIAAARDITESLIAVELQMSPRVS